MATPSNTRASVKERDISHTRGMCTQRSRFQSEFGSTKTLTDGLKIKHDFVPPDCQKKRQAKSGDHMTMQYTGKLTNGKTFDSSRNPGRSAFQFTLGAGQVIKGWDEGLKGVCVGEKLTLTIPPELGYGARGYPPVIPGNSVLIFDVEVVNIS